MDWTEKMEHRKKIRKMAYRMLWADVKDMMLSWKSILVVSMYFFFLLIPYVQTENYNFAGMYYFVIWVLMALNAVSETSFNFLPLSTKDIVYYMKVRTNHLISWLVLLSCLSGIVLDAFGKDVFWERGLLILLFLLITIEWWFFMTLYSYSKPYGTNFLDSCIPTGRKIRIAVYFTYSLVALFGCMIVGMFMDYNEHVKTKLLVMLCIYLVMHIFRADAVRWVKFNEFNKTPNRNMWGNVEQLNQKA